MVETCDIRAEDHADFVVVKAENPAAQSWLNRILTTAVPWFKGGVVIPRDRWPQFYVDAFDASLDIRQGYI